MANKPKQFYRKLLRKVVDFQIEVEYMTIEKPP